MTYQRPKKEVGSRTTLKQTLFFGIKKGRRSTAVENINKQLQGVGTREPGASPSLEVGEWGYERISNYCSQWKWAALSLSSSARWKWTWLSRAGHLETSPRSPPPARDFNAPVGIRRSCSVITNISRLYMWTILNTGDSIITTNHSHHCFLR